jgi:hypothetical protein
MKNKIEILGLLFIMLIQSCAPKDQNEKLETDFFSKYSNDSISSLIFKIAYDNKTCAPSYIVFQAQDLNTGIKKEICCEAPSLSESMHRELNIENDEKGTAYIDSIILSNRLKTFKFKNKNALNNIRFEEYPDIKEIYKVALKNDLDYYHNNFGTNDSARYVHFEKDPGFEKETFAHVMFKIGVISRRDCVTGANILFWKP